MSNRARRLFAFCWVHVFLHGRSTERFLGSLDSVLGMQSRAVRPKCFMRRWFQSIWLAVPSASESEDHCLPTTSSYSPPVSARSPTLVQHSCMPITPCPTDHFGKKAFGNMGRKNRPRGTDAAWPAVSIEPSTAPNRGSSSSTESPNQCDAKERDARGGKGR